MADPRALLGQLVVATQLVGGFSQPTTIGVLLALAVLDRGVSQVCNPGYFVHCVYRPWGTLRRALVTGSDVSYMLGMPDGTCGSWYRHVTLATPEEVAGAHLACGLADSL
jgi:hypothetical protein